MMPPSMKTIPVFDTASAIFIVRCGAMALASTNNPRKPACTTSFATSSAAWGGHTLITIAHLAHNSASVATSVKPNLPARSRVAALLPCEVQYTSQPLFFADAATDIPISPGCRIPTRCGVITFSLLPDVLFDPSEHGFMPALAVHCTQDPMALVGKNKGLRWNAVAAQCGEQLQTLIERNAKILLVRNHKRGCLNIC